jgi:hypothetical protein
MSTESTLDIAPQTGLVNIRTDTLLALNINSSTEDKLKEIFGLLQKHGKHIQDEQFYSTIQTVIRSNICQRTTHTRFAFGLFERKTVMKNHLLRRV